MTHHRTIFDVLQLIFERNYDPIDDSFDDFLSDVRISHDENRIHFYVDEINLAATLTLHEIDAIA